MSDILIKNMDMPENCFDCMFHWHGDGTTYCLAQSKMHDLHHIKWQCKGYEEQMKYREPTCPLIEVPTPHGRLIDADDMESITIDCDARGNWKRINAPTIIESEE